MSTWFSFFGGSADTASSKKLAGKRRFRRPSVEWLEGRQMLSAASMVVEAPVFAGAEFQVDNSAPGTTITRYLPAIAHAGNGDLIVVWETHVSPTIHLHGQRYNATGTPLGGQFTVNIPSGDSASGARIAADATGNFVVVWRAGFAQSLMGRRFNSDGSAAGGEFVIAAVRPGSHDVAMDANGNFAVTWREDFQTPGHYPAGFETRIRLYDAAGNPRGPDFALSAIADTTVATPYIAMDADGDFAVAYASQPLNGYDLSVQRFDENGVRQGAPLLMAEDGFIGDIAMTPGGDFVATWTHEANQLAQPFTDVYAARFNAAGVAQGGVFLVNETIAGHQHHSSVSLDADGNAVFAWQSTQAIPNDFNHPHEVFARKFAADGQPITTEFQVNADQAANLYWTAISSDPNGNCAVVWSRDTIHDGLPEQIYARRFSVVDDLTPAVGDDAYSVDEDGLLTVPAGAGVFVNDNDTDGDGAASDFDGDTIPDVSDPDDDNDGTPDGSDNLVGRTDMTPRVVTGPAHGTLSLNADGSFSYEPDDDFFGADSFTYRVVQSNFVVSGLATVSLSVDSVNDAPSIIASHVFAPERAGGRQLVGWAVFDPGAANEAGQTHAYNVQNVTNPGLFAAPPQLAADGTLTFNIAAGQSGTATFDVQTSDNGGTANGGQDTSIQTFTIEVSDDLGIITRTPEDDISIIGTAGADTLEIDGNVADASLVLRGSLGSYTVLDVWRDVSVDMQGGGGSLNVHGLYLAGGLSITGSGGGTYDIGMDGTVSTTGDFLLSLASGTNTVNVLNLYIAGNINLFTGSGPDTLNLRDATNPNFILSLSSGGTTVIATGEGSDGLNMRYGFIVGGFVINTGGADDVVRVYGSAISGNVAVLGGNGSDQLTIDTNYFVALLQMFGELEDDTLLLQNCIHVGRAEISGGAGEDQIFVGNETAPSVNISAGSDLDYTSVVSSLLGEFFAQLGDGDDTLSLYGNTVRRFSSFDGGPGATSSAIRILHSRVDSAW